MNGDQIGGIIRALGAAIGGILVAKGYLDNDTMNAAIGAMATLGVTVWSVYTNQSSRLAAKPPAK